MLSSRKIGRKATQSVTHRQRSVAARTGATVTMVVTTVGLFIGAGTMPASAASPAPVSPAVAAMAAQLQAMLPQILAARAQTAAQNQAAAVHARGRRLRRELLLGLTGHHQRCDGFDQRARRPSAL